MKQIPSEYEVKDKYALYAWSKAERKAAVLEYVPANLTQKAIAQAEFERELHSLA